MTPPSAGYQALREAAAALDVSARARIRATGEDRQRLLHAVASNSIEGLEPGAGTETFFLNPQGRIQALVRVYVGAEDVLLETADEQRQVLLDYLDGYIIMDDVTLEDVTAQTAAWTVEGPTAEELVRQALGLAIPDDAAHAHVASDDLRAFRSTLSGQSGVWLAAPADRRAEVAERLQTAGAADASAPDLEAVRVENGVPLFSVDYTDKNIPHETGLLQHVSFTKGCYVGQEIVERVRSLGQVNRVLSGVAIEGDELPASRELEFDGKTVGTLTSPVRSPLHGDVRGFAVLRREATAAGAELRIDGHAARTTSDT